MEGLTAKKYLENKGLSDFHYMDSGMINHISEMMEEYHEQKLILIGVSNYQFENYAEFCIECDRKGMKPLTHEDYLKL